jgi:alkylhydroperoxidase/carboxymuconolactone decarboxylase family protein YurZ
LGALGIEGRSIMAEAIKGYVAANLSVGNNRARLLDVLTQLLPFIGYPRTLHAPRVAPPQREIEATA